MELVYLWVEKYKNIKEQGFNFSPRFDCNYDKNSNELTIDEKKDYVNIFPENINITAIVGENGSGKSSIIENILKFLTIEPLKKRSIIIYYDGKSNICITDIPDVNINSIDLVSVVTKNDYNISNKLIVYNHNYEHLNTFFKNYRLIKLDKKEIINLLVFNYSESIDFKLSDFMYIPTKVHIKYKDDESLFELFKKMSSSANKLIIFYKTQNHFEKFLITLCAKDGIDDIEFYKNEENMISRINLTKEELLKLHHDFLSVDKQFDFTKETKKNIERYITSKYFELFEFDLIDKKENTYNDLSHGEQVFFGLLLNIYFYASKESVILLLDEPELSLHPQWQKKLLNEILILLNTFNTNRYQLILTSHSPYIISDLPKENIIFLRNGKQEKAFEHKQTFGANIHTLLSDSFFMEDGLMGEFAKSKINEVIKLLNPNSKRKLSKKNQKYCEDIISIIGEPILQKTLKHQLNKKLNPNETELQKLEREQKEIQKKIAKLTGKNNETN